MTNPYYNPSGIPFTLSRGVSQAMRDEFTAISNGFTSVASAAVPATSPSDVNITGSTGSNKSFATQAGKGFIAGQYVIASVTGSTTNYMHGQVVSYAGTTLTMLVQDIGGSGSHGVSSGETWTIAISGPSGVDYHTAVDQTGGIVGLTGYNVDMKNAAGTFTSYLTNTNTASRTYTLPDRTGTLADNTDLALKANLASPTFTGVVTTPALTLGATAITSSGTEINYLAGVSSAVQTQINGKAASGANTDITSLNNPALGAATATTQSSSDNTTKVATTAMVQSAISATSSTYTAKVSSNDTTPGYLNGKLIAGTNITLTENNNGANETLSIALSGTIAIANGGTNATTLPNAQASLNLVSRDHGVNNVGSFCFVFNGTGTGYIEGDTIAGSLLLPAGINITGPYGGGSALSGTWRVLGRLDSGGATLAQKIA